MSAGHVVDVRDLGTEAERGGGACKESRYGEKLSNVVALIRRLPAGERVLVFVQFQDLLDKVLEEPSMNLP